MSIDQGRGVDSRSNREKGGGFGRLLDETAYHSQIIPRQLAQRTELFSPNFSPSGSRSSGPQEQ
jgi:hypothetical protein